MKTYIVFTNNGRVAVQSNNKTNAYKKAVEAGYKAVKSNVTISSVHIDFVQCAKIA